MSLLKRVPRNPDPSSVAPPVALPTTHQAAAAGLVHVHTVNSNPYRERVLRTPRDGAHPDILRFSLAFLKELNRRGIPMYPHTYVRNKEAQTIAFNKGNSQAPYGSSPHNFGKAVDIVHYSRSWDLTQKEWAVIGTIGKEVARRLNLKITWGGDWRFYDPAHWELTDWRNYS